MTKKQAPVEAAPEVKVAAAQINLRDLYLSLNKQQQEAAVQYFNSYPITCVADGEEPNTKLLPDRNSKDFVEKLNIAETEREHGLLMHKILEHITTGDDIARYVNQYCPPELYSQEEKNSIAEKLQIKLRDERVAHWFDASWDSIQIGRAHV